MADSTLAVGLPPFIGYATLEDWLDAVLPERPVLAMKVAEPRPGGNGLHTEELVVVCQQVMPDLSVHYVRLRAATVTLCYGEPFDSDFPERQAAWESLAACVSAILEETGLTVLKAVVARPRNFTFFEGRSSRIAFDPDTKRYVLEHTPDGGDGTGGDGDG